MSDKSTIYRQDAIDSLRMDVDIIPFAKAREYTRAAIETIYNRLEELPSAQPEREKGEWILVTDNNGQHYECSRCGAWRYHQEQEFCGSCGADMRGKNNGKTN